MELQREFGAARDSGQPLARADTIGTGTSGRRRIAKVVVNLRLSH
jgi:hypothetical protein